jgi:hypothetical protein
MSINHLTSVFCWPDFNRRQFDWHSCGGSRDILDRMGKKLHNQSQTGEGTGKILRNVLFFISPRVASDRPQAFRAPAKLHKTPERFGVALNPPNKVMPTPAQEMQRRNTVVIQGALDSGCDRLLNLKRVFWLEKHLGWMIKVNVLNIEVSEK